MEMILSFVVFLLHNGVSSEYVEVYSNTFTRILNRNYTEDEVRVRNELQCSMFCMTTQYCEAFYYNRCADDSRCHLRKYSTNILNPLIINTSFPGNTSVTFVRKHKEYCVVPPEYQFESNLMFWYKLFETTRLNATDAREACRKDRAYLLLVDDDNQFDFLLTLLGNLNGTHAYIQGVRTSEADPFLNENGSMMTYVNNWKADGLAGTGNYMRYNGKRGWIETSEGQNKRAYICQLRLN